MSSIKGLDSLLRKLDTLGGNSTEVLERGITKAAKRVQRDAKLLCPVDSGDLRNSIRAETEVQDGVVIGKVSTNKEYAPYVEFGTGQRGQSGEAYTTDLERGEALKYPGELSYRQDWVGMPAQPFLYPAMKQNEDKIIGDVANELRKEIRKMAE